MDGSKTCGTRSGLRFRRFAHYGYLPHDVVGDKGVRGRSGGGEGGDKEDLELMANSGSIGGVRRIWRKKM